VKAPWHGADLSVLDKEQFFDELKRLYRKKVLPLELASKYAQFHSAPLNPADFEAKPMVLLLGSSSSFLTFLLPFLPPTLPPSSENLQGSWL